MSNMEITNEIKELDALGVKILRDLYRRSNEKTGETSTEIKRAEKKFSSALSALILANDMIDNVEEEP